MMHRTHFELPSHYADVTILQRERDEIPGVRLVRQKPEAIQVFEASRGGSRGKRRL
jgi:hypothetical protein